MSQTDLKTFIASVDAGVRPDLMAAGFRRVDAGTWNRRSGNDLNVIWIQGHSAEPLCCVNLGVHYAFLPKAGTEEAVSGDEIEQPECEIKLRLTADESAKDQWWPLTSRAAEHMHDLILGRGLELFDAYRLGHGIENLEAKDIESENAGLLRSVTKVRACLLLARIHEQAGRREECIEVARLGLKLAGMAVGPKKALKDILSRCGVPA